MAGWLGETAPAAVGSGSRVPAASAGGDQAAAGPPALCRRSTRPPELRTAAASAAHPVISAPPLDPCYPCTVTVARPAGRALTCR
jgi:hypothetical protein